MKKILIERISNLEERNKSLKEEMKKSQKENEKQFFEIIIDDNKSRINECEYLLKVIKEKNKDEWRDKNNYRTIKAGN